MRGAILYGPRDIRFQDRPEPKVIKPTDAFIIMIGRADEPLEETEVISGAQPYEGLKAAVERAKASRQGVLGRVMHANDGA